MFGDSMSMKGIKALAVAALIGTSAVVEAASPYHMKVKYDVEPSSSAPRVGTRSTARGVTSTVSHRTSFHTGVHTSMHSGNATHVSVHKTGNATHTTAVHMTGKATRATSHSTLHSSHAGIHSGSNATHTTMPSLNVTTSSISPLDTKAPAAKDNSTQMYQHDGLNPNLNPRFSAKGDWLTKSCLTDDFAGKSLTTDGATMWKEADADTALQQLLDGWNNRPALIKDWTFSHFVWNVFNVTGGTTPGPYADCSDPHDTLCSITIKCDPTIGIKPAGYLIVNSMVTIHKIYQMQFNAIHDAYTSIGGSMQTVVDNFDWQPKHNNDMEILEEILGFATTALGMVSGGTISTAFSAIKMFGTMTAKTGETIHSVASKGIEITNDILGKMPAPTQQGDIYSDLNAILSAGFNGLSAGVTGMLETLTESNGHDNQTLLQNLMDTGLLLDYYNTDTNNTNDVTKKAVSMMYGQIIPAAWSLSVENLRPFILRMDAKDMKCNGSFPHGDNGEDISSYFDKDVAQQALWCDDQGNSYWLLTGRHQDNCNSRFGCDGQNKKPFGMLPGGNSSNLDGSRWGGLHLGDIIRSSWGGFQANNKQNGYSVPQGSSAQVANNMTLQGSNGLPMSGGVLTPGFFNFTICLDYKEAIKTLRGNDKSAPICGHSPAPGGSSTGMNAPGAFTPGWCRLHVTQYQRNEGNENPLSDYQIDVNIFDSASLMVGDATKQSSAHPLSIANSVLPSRLIVGTGKGDDDPVSFWYSDQHWDSTSKDNQCSQGRFDGGKREIDCGFQCPLPGSGSPPVSATVGHPLPGSPTDAVAGDQKFVNTYITATPTPTPTPGAPPPPKPTPNYATGWCGVHVRQYQKHEKDVNPTGDYQIEATIYDGKNHAIGSSGKVAAGTNTPVTINGLISPFTVTAFYVDGDGMRMSFNGDTWWSNSTRCGVGSYDGGHRDMDCGFGC